VQALPWDLLERLTPYHAAWDSEGALVRISEPLRNLWRTEESLPALQENLKLVRPFEGRLDPAWLPELTHLSLLVTHAAKPEHVIRGQVIRFDELWLLVGSPNVHSVEGLSRMGLSLSDLPIHDGTGDLLIAVETSLVSHRETRARSEQLREANEELRDVNAALTGFVPRPVLKSLGLDKDLQDDVGTRTEAVGRFIEHLQAAIQFRERFLASMSHELRTPLNAILGVTEALQEGIYGTLTGKQGEMLRTVQDSGGHLLSLINDVLDLSRIEAGEAGLLIEECNLDELCNSALQLVRQQYQEKGLELRHENRSTQKTIPVDKRRVRQVLLNLLSNALKFTDQGHVSLQVNDLPSEDSVRICVVDTGIGIPPADQDKVFQPFFQVDHGLSRKHPGTGLGLAISRRTLALHRGRMELESVPGEGSRFSLILPLHPNRSNVPVLRPVEVSESPQAVPKAGGAGPLAANRGSRKTPPCVLIVDDVADNREHLVDYLEHHGFETEIADSGLSALQRISASKPDIILLDIQMPGMNGLDVTRCLRAMPATRTIPIIALTGLATDRDRCMEAGVSAFRAKPYNMSELLELVGQLLDQQDSDQGEDGQ
jgi:signal transduction histidine kinase/CheY-like chemotaxis protein